MSELLGSQMSRFAETTRLKILHVSNMGDRFDGARYYGVPIRLNNGLTRNGHCTIFFDDRAIAKRKSLFGSRILRRRATNNALIRVAANFRPDVILLGHADIIDSQSLDTIRQILPNLKMACYRVDGLFANDSRAKIRNFASHCDAVFVTTSGDVLSTVCTGATRAYFFPNPVDASIDRGLSFSKSHLPTDIFFACGSARRGDMRETGPNAILKNQPELRCEFFGVGRRVEHVWGWQFMAALARSKIGLNLSSKPTPFLQGNGSDTYFYSSDRVALLMGNGLLTFAERGFCLSELYGNHRLIEFEDTAELVDKVAYFSRKDEERRAIAERGHEFVHREFNERIVANQGAGIIETAKPVEGAEVLIKPTRKGCGEPWSTRTPSVWTEDRICSTDMPFAGHHCPITRTP